MTDRLFASYSGRVAFCVGTGRCGTQFLAKVLAQEPEVAVSHERHRLAESFERYCRWFDLPVDAAGFINVMGEGIRQDLISHRLSFESSSYLSLNIKVLYEQFDARFIAIVRRPDRTINSLLSKGWYEHAYVQVDPDQALGFQQQTLPHHLFSRISPRGEKFDAWNQMTRVGKIAWFWKTINGAILDQLDLLPDTHRRLVKLEDLDHAAYAELTRFLGFETVLTPAQYETIAGQRPNKLPQLRRVQDWTVSEWAEFEAEVEPVAERLGYAGKKEALLALYSTE